MVTKNWLVTWNLYRFSAVSKHYLSGTDNFSLQWPSNNIKYYIPQHSTHNSPPCSESSRLTTSHHKLWNVDTTQNELVTDCAKQVSASWKTMLPDTVDVPGCQGHCLWLKVPPTRWPGLQQPSPAGLVSQSTCTGRESIVSCPECHFKISRAAPMAPPSQSSLE